MKPPTIWDWFCCQGGAAKGYADAGFRVVGFDIEPQPRYPFEFIQVDVVKWVGWLARTSALMRVIASEGVVGIHASPPCQLDSKTFRLNGNAHPDLIAPTRELLETTGLPYVIENVEDAAPKLRDPQMLCGTMFGLRLYRHRLFETNWPLTAPLHGEHYLPQVKMGRSPEPHHILQPVGNFAGVAEAREAMGMPWASRDGLREAIPPAYTEYIGRQLMQELNREKVTIGDILDENWERR